MVIAHERVKLMKQVWSQCRNAALTRFQKDPTLMAFTATPIEPVILVGLPLPEHANSLIDVFTFVREINRGWASGEKFWRITCDGIEVEVWQFQ